MQDSEQMEKHHDADIAQAHAPPDKQGKVGRTVEETDDKIVFHDLKTQCSGGCGGSGGSLFGVVVMAVVRVGVRQCCCHRCRRRRHCDDRVMVAL